MHKKRHPVIFTLNVLIFLFLTMSYYTAGTYISIKGITPLLTLPLLTAFSLFHSPIRSAICGMMCGILMDSCMIDAYCFNAIILLVAGTFVSVTSSNLFNKNIKSSMLLSLIVCAFYYIFQWIFFHTTNVTLNDSLLYLLNFSFPSVVFSAVFIIPFFFLYRHFNKITSE